MIPQRKPESEKMSTKKARLGKLRGAKHRRAVAATAAMHRASAAGQELLTRNLGSTGLPRRRQAPRFRRNLGSLGGRVR